MQKTAVWRLWPLCSIFSNSGHVFEQIKNPNVHFVQDTLSNNHKKFHPNPFSIFREEMLEELLTTTDEDGHQVIMTVRCQLKTLTIPATSCIGYNKIGSMYMHLITLTS